MPLDTERFARQIGLAGFGAAAQARLAASGVLVVGAGGLGVPAATYLAAAGVGRIGLVDDDRVAATNLHRQVAYTPADVGRLKVDALADRLRAQNPAVDVTTYPRRLTLAGAEELVRGYDLVIDGSDNLPTRYLVDDLCALVGRPLVYGAAQAFEGQVAVFHATAASPTYRCLFPEDPAHAAIPNCAVGGVLGVVPGVIGTLQALEAVKVLTGVGEALDGRLLVVDGLTGAQHTLAVAPVATNRTVSRAVLLARHAEPEEVSPAGLALRLADGAPTVDVRTAAERASDPLPGTEHVPLAGFDEWLAARAAELAGQVCFVCASGRRSREAARRFNRATGSRRGVTVAGGAAALAQLRQRA